ncbi:MAG: tripartite tricarboxylate transporter substrate binding protein [Pseudomonadota bacterium]
MRALVGALLLLLLALPAQAVVSYPTKLVRLIVAFPPGGTNDAIARLLAQRLSETWGQPVIVDNRAGAGGTIGTDLVARAEPDGYTLLVTPPGPITTNASLYAKLPYDPTTAFAPVTVISTAPNLLLINPKRPETTVAALVAAAQAAPGKITYASQGTGTTSHLTGALFATTAGIALVHVPYKGSAPAVNDLLSGQVDIMFDAIGNSLGHVRGGTLRALALSGERRLAALPALPTMIEAGFPHFTSVVWYSMVAPAGTPAERRGLIADAVGGILGKPDMVERLAQLGNQPVGNTPDQMAAFMAAETARWTRVIKAAGIQPE